MPTRRFIKIALPIVILLSAVVIYFLLVAWPVKAKARAQVERAWPVQVLSIQAGAHRPNLLLYARVESSAHASVSARVTAQVLSLEVRDGQRVNQGQTILRLNPRQARVDWLQAKAAWVDAHALVAHNQFELKAQQRSLVHEETLLTTQQRALLRREKLIGTQHISEEGLDKQRAAYSQQALMYEQRLRQVNQLKHAVTQLQAKQLLAQSRMQKAQYDLDSCNVTAPFSGTITHVFVAKGERVTPGVKLFRVLATQDLEARALIPPAYVSRLRQARQAAEVPAVAQLDHHTIQLSLQRIAGTVQPGQLGVEGVFFVHKGNEVLPHGKVFTLLTSLPTIDHSYVVPVSSLYQNDKLYVVKNKRLHAVTVVVRGKIYRFSGQTKLIVSSDDLRSGDQVLINQIPNAIDGLLVTPGLKGSV